MCGVLNFVFSLRSNKIGMKIVVIILGPPGSGKSTQAILLANKAGLLHFDTGHLLESIVHDPKRQKEPVVKRERQLFDSGKLMTPEFVVREVIRHLKVIAVAGWGVVFSGSPRTLGEATKLLPELEKLYGQKNIFPFSLDIPAAYAIQRNSRRFACKVCGAPLLTKYYPSKKPKHCPVCAGSLYRRTLDKPEIIKVRLKEYHKRTEPVFSFFKKYGYEIRKIDGRPAPYKVLSNIYRHLKTRNPKS